MKIKLGFLANDDSKEDKTSDSNWISTEDGEEDKKEISLFDSSSEEEMVTNLVDQLLQTISFPNRNVAKNTFIPVTCLLGNIMQERDTEADATASLEGQP